MTQPSITQFDDAKAGETPFKLQVLTPAGLPSGLVLDVFGDEAAPVEAVRNRLVDEERARAAAVEAMAKPGEPLPIKPASEDIRFRDTLCAARIAGWNAKEPFTPDNALLLCSKSSRVREQVTKASMTIGNFTER